MGFRGVHIYNVHVHVHVVYSVILIYSKSVPYLYNAYMYMYYLDSKKVKRLHMYFSEAVIIMALTSSHRRLYQHTIYFGTADRRASKRALRFLCYLAGALSTCHTLFGFLPNTFIQDLFV